MIRTAEAAYSGGWHHLKLYFMCGLPTERDEDVVGIARIADRVAEAGRSVGRRNAKVTASCGGFVPKPHTPFQWAAQDSVEEIDRKLLLLRRAISSSKVKLRAHGGFAAQLEGFLSRGDRRIGPVIESAWRRGARFDQWGDHFQPDLWIAAAEEVGIDIDWYATRPRGRREAFPWDHIFSGVEKDWLWDDWQAALREQDLDDCRWGPCTDCGTHGLGTSDECHEISAEGRIPLPLAIGPAR
jgi:hypothetical protein